MIRQLSLAALGAALWSTPARAQLPHLLPASSPWLDINYPKLFWTPSEGLTGGGYLALVRQLSMDNADAAAPYAGIIALNGQASTSGSRELTLEGRFPALVNGWRFVATLAASRRARANYFGVGNSTDFDEANVTDTQRHYYQALERSTLARGEIQRQVVGGLRALVGIHTERRSAAPLPGPSLLATDLASSTYPAGSSADVVVRAGLVFDTRDDEPSPNRGVLLEAIHSVTAGSAPDYSRTTVSGAGYVRAGENLVLSARAMAQAMGGTPRIDAYQLIEASDRPYNGLGGAASHRALDENRFLGRHKILLNLDARYHLGIPRAARGSIVLFLDAGRVFEGESLRLTTDDLKVGGGIGIFAQLGRAGIIGTTLGAGPDGPVLNVATRWAY